MLRLPEEWIEHLRLQPETGMGYQVVTISTRHGQTFPQAIVDSGHVTRIRGMKEIPFTQDDIVGITVTHDKWNWKNEP